MNLTLTRDEIQELTGSARADAQARELAHMRIPYRTRRNGKIVVLRFDVINSDGTATKVEPASPALRLP
jgi:GTP cyclohydrolase III